MLLSHCINEQQSTNVQQYEGHTDQFFRILMLSGVNGQNRMSSHYCSVPSCPYKIYII